MPHTPPSLPNELASTADLESRVGAHLDHGRFAQALALAQQAAKKHPGAVGPRSS
jgi:hypothetical protein